jgi:pimeloyl-ACP methyl ester carboxylesterase
VCLSSTHRPRDAHRSGEPQAVADYHLRMRTDRIPVADGVELAADTWAPGPARASEGSAEAEATRVATARGAGVSGAAGAGASGAAGSDDAPAAEGPAETPFLLVHGLASNARMWDGVAAALVADGHTVVTVDLRGHGRSSKPDGPYDVPTVAGDLAALIDRMALDRPVVAGQSWGGNVALELAVRHPASIRGIVCVDGGWFEPSRDFPDWDTCRAALAPPRLAGRHLAEVEGFVRSAHPDWPEAGIRGVVANFEVLPDGTVAPWLTYDRHIEVLRGMWDHHPSAEYATIAVPVLLAPADGGEGDRMQRKRRDVAAADAAIPRARVRWFIGDHDIHAQHPGELASVMHAMTIDGFFS